MAKEYNAKDFLGEFDDLIDKIEKLPHFRSWKCPSCGSIEKLHVLRLYGTCSRCDYTAKFRGYSSPGLEVQDVIEGVLQWIGRGEQEGLEEVMDIYLSMKKDSRHEKAIEDNTTKSWARGTLEQTHAAAKQVFEELGIVNLHWGTNEAKISARLIGYVPEGSRVTLFIFNTDEGKVELMANAMHPFDADLGKKVIAGLVARLGK